MGTIKINRSLIIRSGGRIHVTGCGPLYHLIWNHFNPNNPVTKGCDVHHKDGISSNDFIGNLTKLSHREHTKLHKMGNLFWVGKSHSEESKKKISISRKGKLCGNQNPMRGIDFSGKSNPFYGKKHTEESLKKMSDVKKGKIQSDETKKKRSLTLLKNPPMKGKKHSEETRRKIGDAKRGKVSPKLGKTYTKKGGPR